MNNGNNNANFLAAITDQAKLMILQAIAKHYGVSVAEIFEEVTAEDSEHLLDYMTGAERLAASVLMQKHGF